MRNGSRGDRWRWVIGENTLDEQPLAHDTQANH